MKLTHPNGESLTLSDDLLWADEFSWRDVAQTELTRTLSGGYVIQQGLKQKGRPISLEPPDNMAWHTRAIAQKLQAWAGQPETVFSLEMTQGTFDVLFVELSAEPVLGFGGEKASDWFKVKIRFLTA